MFNTIGDLVVLIEKTKPEWQKGLLNGVGGKIERGESPVEAMVREFQEETTLDTSEKDWNHFTTMTFGNRAKVHCFSGFSNNIFYYESPTEEKVKIYMVSDIIAGTERVIPNLKWLIPMCLHDTELGKSEITYE